MTIKEYQKITKDLSKTIKQGKGHVIFAIIVDGETNDLVSVLDGGALRVAKAISKIYDKNENFRKVMTQGIGLSETFQKEFNEEN